MLNRMKNRISSNRADSTTISQLLWIVLTVVLVLAIGALIARTVASRGKNAADLIDGSNENFNDAINEGLK